MLDIFLQYKKQIFILIGLLIVLVVGLQLYTINDRRGKVAVIVTSVPDDAKITLNGSQVIKPGENYLAPGTYSVVAHKEGFEDSKITFTAEDRNKSGLNIALTPLSDEAKRWAQDNQDLYLEPEKEGGEEAIKQGEAFRQANPIVDKLPYEDPYYTIGYKSPDDKTVELTITAPSALYRYHALLKIREWGYDPTDFKVTYNYEDQLQ